tara:strand:- start:2550 stop:3575 length:1026 start_codon:yes stop_codon:yes gene_type:complete
MYYLVEGRNNSSYIIYVSSLNSIKYSFSFYKPITLWGKFIKIILIFYVLLNSKFFKKNIKNLYEINKYISNIFKINIQLRLGDCALISPTRDKIIIKKSEVFFRKIGVNHSFNFIKREYYIYKLFNRSPKSFQISKVDNFLANNGYVCEFTLDNSNIKTHMGEKINLITILSEFFQFSNPRFVYVSDYLKDLLKNLDPKNHFKQIFILKKIISICVNQKISLGLTHGDFKPWNIINYKKPLIYDFETSIEHGLPLSDLINYKIEPLLLNNIKPITCVELLLDEKVRSEFYDYLKILDINISLDLLVNIILIEKIIFWHSKESPMEKKYILLSNILSSKIKL